MYIHTYICIYIYIYIHTYIRLHTYIRERGFPSRDILSLGALGPGSGPFPGFFVASRVARRASPVRRHENRQRHVQAKNYKT